jgi:type VI secretion system protein ImpA
MTGFERLLEAASTEPPCGPNLEYDAGYLELLRLARGRPEQQIGDTVTEAEEPDWRAVAAKAGELLESTKDIRIALLLTKASLRTRGFLGFADGLQVLAGLLERYWEHVHPQLDPDDDHDPTMRINVLADLTDASVLGWVRTTPLVTARGLGSFNLRDVMIANGEIPAPEGEKPAESSSIEAAFSATDTPALQETATAVQAARDRVRAIEAVTTDRAGTGMGAELSKLRALLDQANKVLEPKLAARGALANASQPDAVPTNGAAAVAAPLSGVISTPDQVIEALDKIIAYYERNEPSSPLPLLLNRCKKLVRMSFMDIVRDIAPDAVTQVEALRGRIE